jgi:serine/threonine-protein kinase
MDLPARIGKYELLEFLGGGMSHVYRGRDTVIGREVAIKILTEAGSADEAAKARFLQEVRMAGNIQHDNIVAIYDYGEEGGRPFIVMEMLRGQDLRTAIERGSLTSVPAKLNVALQAARALGYVHSHSIVHRDIKPENIHLDAAGKTRLMDFGIAKAANLNLTQPGTALGTPFYMPPEQVLGHPITPLVDVYAFGIVLYELVTGVKPIKGETLENIFYLILNQPIDLDLLRQHGASEGLVSLIARCVAKKAEDRPQDFDAICLELEALLNAGQPLTTLANHTPTTANVAQPGTTAYPISPDPPVSETPAEAQKSTGVNGMALGVAGALFLAIAVAGGYYFLHKPAAPVEKSPDAKTDVTKTAPELARSLSTPTGVMVLVAAGEFPSGADRKPVSLPAFYIDRTEVLNGAYADFCKSTGHSLPQGFEIGRAHLPVVNVTIGDARAYAKWAGKRLPTALEWEKAARGAAGFAYPWGNEADPKRANVQDNPDLKEHVLLGGSANFGTGQSPYGAFDMAGNVWEFVEADFTPSPKAVENFSTALSPPPTAKEKWCQIRGGSFDTPLTVAYEWMAVPERYTAPSYGFRCVRDP